MTQCPFPLRRVSVDTSRMLEGFHVSSREVREERGPMDVVQAPRLNRTRKDRHRPQGDPRQAAAWSARDPAQAERSVQPRLPRQRTDLATRASRAADSSGARAWSYTSSPVIPGKKRLASQSLRQRRVEDHEPDTVHDRDVRRFAFVPDPLAVSADQVEGARGRHHPDLVAAASNGFGRRRIALHEAPADQSIGEERVQLEVVADAGDAQRRSRCRWRGRAPRAARASRSRGEGVREALERRVGQLRYPGDSSRNPSRQGPRGAPVALSIATQAISNCGSACQAMTGSKPIRSKSASPGPRPRDRAYRHGPQPPTARRRRQPARRRPGRSRTRRARRASGSAPRWTARPDQSTEPPPLAGRAARLQQGGKPRRRCPQLAS